MTREEAIKVLGYGGWWDSLDVDISDADLNPLEDALAMAIAALCGPTREQVEKAWRGEWMQTGFLFKCVICSKCRTDFKENFEDYPFCPQCGAPMTDEAMDIMMRRLEGME